MVKKSKTSISSSYVSKNTPKNTKAWLAELIAPGKTGEKILYEDKGWVLTYSTFDITEGDYAFAIFIYDKKRWQWHYYDIGKDDIEPDFCYGSGELKNVPLYIDKKVRYFWKIRRLL